jgi:hypothetical protein
MPAIPFEQGVLSIVRNPDLPLIMRGTTTAQVGELGRVFNVDNFGYTSVAAPYMDSVNLDDWRVDSRGSGAGNCNPTIIGGKMEFKSTQISLHDFLARKEFCAEQLKNTQWADFQVGANWTNLDGRGITNWFQMGVLENIIAAERERWLIGTGITTDALRSPYKGLMQFAFEAVTANTAQRITIAQNTALNNVDAIGKVRELLRKQTNKLASVPARRKKIILTRALYDRLRDALNDTNVGTSDFIRNYVNGVEIITLEGIQVVWDARLAELAIAVNFANRFTGVTDTSLVFVGILYAMDNFVIATSSPDPATDPTLSMFKYDDNDLKYKLTLAWKTGTHWYFNEFVTLAV